jgi:hypothetical protein
VERLTIVVVLYVLRIRCSMAGISWDANWDGEVLSMPSAGKEKNDDNSWQDIGFSAKNEIIRAI